MATLVITRLYEANEVLFEVDLDEIRSDIETFTNTTKLNDDNIQDGGIDAETKLLAGSVTSGLIASNAVTTSKIQDGAVDSAALGTSAITSAKIDSVTKLSGSPFATSAVTYEKLTSVATRFSLNNISNTVSSTSWTSMGSTSIECTGNRSIIIMLLPNNPSSGDASILLSRAITSGVSPVRAYFKFQIDGVDEGFSEASFVAYRPTSSSTTFKYSIPSAVVCKVNSPASGTIGVTLLAKTGSASENLSLNCRLLIWELE